MQAPGSQRPMWRDFNYRDKGTRSVVVGGAAKILPDSETPTQFSPYGTFVPSPHHPEMPRSLMDVAQAHMLNSQPNPWPASGVWDVPNAQNAVVGILRLKPTTSAHPGATNPTGPGPTMVFSAPPIFGYQTRPIMAVGI